MVAGREREFDGTGIGNEIYGGDGWRQSVDIIEEVNLSILLKKYNAISMPLAQPCILDHQWVLKC